MKVAWTCDLEPLAELSQRIINRVGPEFDAMRLLEPKFGLACGLKFSRSELFGKLGLSLCRHLALSSRALSTCESCFDTTVPEELGSVVNAIAVTA